MKKNLSIGRVIIEEKNRYMLLSESGEVPAIVSKKIVKNAYSLADFPKVGDWVLYDRYNENSDAVIYQILDRKTKVSRKSVDPTPGKLRNEEQILVTNIDILFIVQSADQNFNLKRLDRYVATAYAGNVRPVVLINKIDINPQFEKLTGQVRERFPDILVLGTSIQNPHSIEKIRELIPAGVSASFVGSSGVGKSSIINSLIGNEIIKTKEISEKLHKGRHTTTHRELLLLLNGGAVIDTPGIRELSLWDAEEGLDSLFSDIFELARKCRYPDCSHTNDQGCAILLALENGELEEERFEQFLKLSREGKSRKSHPQTGKKFVKYKTGSKDRRINWQIQSDKEE